MLKMIFLRAQLQKKGSTRLEIPDAPKRKRDDGQRILRQRKTLPRSEGRREGTDMAQSGHAGCDSDLRAGESPFSFRGVCGLMGCGDQW